MKDRTHLRIIQCTVTGVLIFGIAVGQTNRHPPQDVQPEACAEGVTGITSPTVTLEERDRGAALKRARMTNKKQMTPRELLEQLRTLKKLGLDVRGDIPEDGPEADAYAELLYRQWINREGEISAGVQEEASAGRLMIFARHDAKASADKAHHYLNELQGSEWVAIFRDALKCPMGLDEPFTAGDSLNQWHERVRLKFQKAIPDYPLLGRIWDTSIDITYQMEEIKQLRDECLRVQASTSNEKALAGLTKLISACEQASMLGSGLLLACD